MAYAAAIYHSNHASGSGRECNEGEKLYWKTLCLIFSGMSCLAIAGVGFTATVLNANRDTKSIYIVNDAVLFSIAFLCTVACFATAYKKCANYSRDRFFIERDTFSDYDRINDSDENRGVRQEFDI